MNAQRFLTTAEEELGWKRGILSLAIEGVHPLLSSAGVPQSIVRSPLAAMEVARAFLATVEDLPRDGYADPEHLRQVEAQLRLVFDQLAERYAQEVSREVRTWVSRHFVEARRHKCWIWGLLLHTLAGVYGRGPSEASPLAASATQRFAKVVAARFNLSARERDKAEEAQARRAVLSPLERRLVALEVSSPDDPVEIDIVRDLVAVISCERARETWSELKQVLGPGERELLIAWARRVGATDGIPENLIAPLM